VAHLKGLLGSGNLVFVISPNFAQDREAVNEQLKAQRVPMRKSSAIFLPISTSRREPRSGSCGCNCLAR